MSDRGHTPTVFLLLKQKSDGRRKTTARTVSYVVRKGELLEEIPEAQQGDEGDKQQHFHLVHDPSVTLWCTATDVAPLVGSLYHYLMAVSPPERRIQEFLNAEKKEWVTRLKNGDGVLFRMKDQNEIKGKICYVGPVEKKEGVYFGVEIKDDKYRGKGTTTGEPYFSCGRKDAVWVSMDQLIYRPGSSQSPNQHAPAEPTSTAPRKSSRETSTQSIESRKWKFLSSTAHTAVGKEHQIRSSFKEGDRVVVHSFEDNRPIPATVRWTGARQMSRMQGSPIVMFAGLETDTVINPDEDFPETHIDLRGIKGATFRVEHGHAWVYLPEQMLVTEDEFKKEQQKQLKEKAGLEVSMNTAVELGNIDIHRQREMLAEANARHAKQQKERQVAEGKRESEAPGDEESLTVGTGPHQPSRQPSTDIDPLAGMSHSERQLQCAEMERFKREKREKDAQKAEGRHHMPQGAAPGVFYAAAAAGGLPHDESTGGLHPSQHHVAQTRSTGNGAGGFEHQALPGYPQREDNLALYQQQMSALGQQQRDHIGGAPLYQNMSGVPPCQQSGSGKQQPGVPSYHRQNSGSRQQQQHLSEYPSGSQALAAVPPLYSNALSVEPPPGSPTVHHCQSTPDQQQQQQQWPSQVPSWLALDTVVVLKYSDQALSGEVKFIGQIPGFTGSIAGLELNVPMSGCTDGVYQGRRYFHCPPGRGYFCRIDDLQPLGDFPSTGATSGAGGVAHTDPAAYITNPLDKFPDYVDDDQFVDVELFKRYIGDERGVQGHHNSCYLDATVFGLFALSDVFDMMFLTEPKEGMSLPVSSPEVEKHSNKTKQILWKGIVNPLRKHGVARYESVMVLRNYLEQLGAMEGANRDEKDPEEFLNMLFKKVLHVRPFISIRRPFGVEEEYFVQLFFEIDPKQNTLPYTEALLWKMFKEQQISFTKVPSKLLLQMPRFGKEFKMYSRVIPSLTLDVGQLLDSVSISHSLRANPLVCFLCGAPAAVSCTQCAAEVFQAEGDKVHLCKECCDKSHKIRQEHKRTELLASAGDGGSRISEMELLSVICIETSHYVCFTRFEDRWLFHDSMANRLYDMYNIPRVTEVTKELREWVYQGDPQRLMSTPSWEIPECVRRFTQDGYMCVYINPNMEMYGDAV